MAVFFLVFELISAASSAIVVLSYYNQAKQECSNMSSSDDDGDGDVSVGNYDKNIESMAYAVAKAMEKAYGYKAELVFAQLGHETGFGKGYTIGTEDLNLSGIKYQADMSDYAKPGQAASDGGTYCKFKSLDAYATVYYKWFLKPDFGKTKPKTVQEWAHLLKVHKYYQDSEENYISGMNSFIDEYKKYEAAHKNDSKKDSSSSSKKKTSTAKKKTTTARKKKTAAVVHNQKKTLSDLIVDVDKPEETGDMNDLVKKESEKNTISETAKEDAKSTSKASKASSASKTSSKATSSSKASSKTSSKKDDSKSSSSKKDDSTDSSSDESNSESSLGMTEDSCKAMGFETEDDDNDSSGDWAYPFKGMTYKSAKANLDPAQAFGTGSDRTNSYHDGVDFGTAKYGGKAIRAIHDGKVIDVSVDSSDISGHVVTKSSDGWYIVYQEFYHTEGSKYVKVKKGQTVHAGDTIGILAELHNGQNVSHVHIGMTKKVWRTAIQDSFSSAGGWKDPLEMIKKGIASGGKLGSMKLTGSQKQKLQTMVKALKKIDPKATNEGIAAIIGCWQFETGGKSGDINPEIVNSIGAKGLGQWLGSRASALDAYAKKKGKSWKDPGVQIEFAYKGEGSLSTLFRSVLEGKGSVSKLAYKFSHEWEVGGYDDEHVEMAVKFYNSFFK